ncbi:relaxase/mobilization nuclease domain-containing protein [Agreia pratensis]|uniref:relaxase/mobilization nuclease domain-containing protein n=1 Tax=Agreia pratensis TaxID=150121 RepID=UPI00188CA8EF|nr:relaxase/mobilization nuclease domain-containing protein [Agreia pratensis]MBF4636200.1 relaxase/mobilization nuclease domain-containing protein [Agreia pratensis]
MMPNITRGGRVAGLLSYLVGEGRSNEHSNPHVVAGHDVMLQASPAGELSIDDALDLANLLDQPRKVFGTSIMVPVREWDDDLGQHVKVGEKEGHVWHASLSLNSGEGPLSDHQWQLIANDFVSEMGFVDVDGAESCRWVAVRHGLSKNGNDHIHIAVNLVREDGRRQPVHNDFQRSQEVVNGLEKKYGLVVLESREEEREGLRGYTPKEQARATRSNAPVIGRDELRRRLRAAAETSTSEREFLSKTRDSRLLVRPRFGKDDTTKVVGFSVALVPDIVDGKRENPAWFAPSKLDSNLGLGQLRDRWSSTPESEADALPVWIERGSATRAGELDVRERIKLETMSPESVRQLNAIANQIVVPDRQAGYDRYAAVHLSGAFAQASLYFEKDKHGPLAGASELFARQSQRAKYTSQDPQRRALQSAALGANAAYTARLVARATGADSVTGWTAVFKQLNRIGRAVEGAQRARGNLAAAAATATAVTRAVASFEAAVQKGTTARPARQVPVAPRARIHNNPTTNRGNDTGAGRD